MSEWWGWLLPSCLEPVLPHESASSLWVGTRISLGSHLLALHLGQQGWSGGGRQGVSFSLWVVLQQGLIHVLGSPRHLPWESSTTHPGNPRDASCSQAGGALGSLSGQQPQSKSEQVKNTNQEEGRPQAVLTQWATREPGLKQGHTRADLSGLDGRPHRWVSHPRFVVPLAHPCLCLAPSPWSGSWPRD